MPKIRKERRRNTAYLDVPMGWTAKLDDRSAGCYVIEGQDARGRKIKYEGEDPTEYWKDLIEMLQQSVANRKQTFNQRFELTGASAGTST